MNQSYWAIINHFEIALINNELPLVRQKRSEQAVEKA